MDYYKEIKNELIDNQIYKRVKDYSKDKYELEKYYNVGKLLIEAQGGEEKAKYGDGLIKEYSKRLTHELGKGYTFTALTRIRKFYLISQKVATLSQLSWSHYIEILKYDDINEINYYINISVKQGLSVRELRLRIKNKEYKRLDENTKCKLINKKENTVTDFIKHPIVIRNKYNITNISEKVLQKLILEDIPSFLDELGSGFTFIRNEYKIRIGNNYNYIDLLLFNIEFNCYVVIELKVTELKKEHIGQIQVYMNYIDNNLKKIDQNKTIGIIICRQDNKNVIKYFSDNRIIAREYELV